MKSGQVAAAVGIGYLLGRTKKMRLAMMIAAAGAIGKLGGGPSRLLGERLQRITDVPEVGELAENVRGDLLGAARSAAMAVATSRIGSLNERLRDQNGSSTDRDEPEEEPEQEDKPKSRSSRGRSTNRSTRSRTAPVRRGRS